MAASTALYHRERADLAAAFRWAARLNFHEGVANHFSVAVNEDGTQFLMNPNQSHFSRIKASAWRPAPAVPTCPRGTPCALDSRDRPVDAAGSAAASHRPELRHVFQSLRH